MNLKHRGKCVDLANAIKSVVVLHSEPEPLKVYPAIKAGDALKRALETGTLAEQVADAFLTAIDAVMDSGTATSQHPDVIHARQEANAAKACSDMERMQALRNLLTAKLEAIELSVVEEGFFPDLLLVRAASNLSTQSCDGIQGLCQFCCIAEFCKPVA